MTTNHKQTNSRLAEDDTSKEASKHCKDSAAIHDDNNKSKQSNDSNNQDQQRELSLAKKLTVDCLIYLIKVVIAVYDLITRPIFYLKDEVHKRRHEVETVERSCQIDPHDPNSAWRHVNIESRQLELEAKIDKYETYDELMGSSFRSLGDSVCYGYRKIIAETFTKRPDSPEKLLRQVKLSDYLWVTFKQFERQIEAARRGFLLQGVRSGDRVMIYADTRAEWQICSQALLRLGSVVVTMYSTLGVDGIIHCVNETKVSHVVAQKDKVNKLLKLKAKLPNLSKIIYMEPVLELSPEFEASDSTKHSDPIKANGQVKNIQKRQWPKDFEHPDVECVSLSQMLAEGLESEGKGQMIDLERQSQKVRSTRTKDSIAVIMYTSGSTGIPKGVLISHRNIMACLKSFSYVTKDFVHKPKENICTAYLPLAHIFEFCIESVMLYHGVTFGFATPHTLTDKSPGLQPGQVGDLTLLKPTVMIIVPLILDRIVQGVKQALRSQSYFKEQLVTYLIRYKIYWQRRHYDTPLVDKIVCSKIATALGGRAKYVICGSAPLSGETQTFVRAALNLKLPQGFGTTETCAATACQLFDDQSTCNVGLPVAGAMIKLEPWIEGNYRPNDKPHPRGEIVVGGEMIAHGYFNLDEQTKESFYTDNNGTRWYRTGDIGEFLPNGNLKIIDRKKDLVKLQNGEYISLGKVESTLKSNPYTENFCVYANSNHNYVVALGPANETSIKALAKQIVEEEIRKSPQVSKKSYQEAEESNGNSKSAGDEQKLLLKLSADLTDQSPELGELIQVLASYESDKMNNNEHEPSDSTPDRKMSTLSNCSIQSKSKCINERLSRLCENKLIQQRVMKHLNELAKERELASLEVPKKLLLLAEEWTEDKNLVTAAMKIRRNYIYKRYEHELAHLYTSKQAAARG